MPVRKAIIKISHQWLAEQSINTTLAWNDSNIPHQITLKQAGLRTHVEMRIVKDVEPEVIMLAVEHKVEDLAIAIVPREEVIINPEEDLWDTYIINLKDEKIKSVLIASQGYGEIEGEEIKTTTLRHFFEEIGPLEILKIEPIQRKLFDLTNEYWVSFNFDGYMYDKKYVFVKGSIAEYNFTLIPFINKKGVMIR